MTPERPIDIWNEMTARARETGRCMFCETPVTRSFSGRRPVICTEGDCRKAYHRMYRHLVRNPRERNEPAEVVGSKKEERSTRRRESYANLSESEREALRAKSREYHRKWYRNLTAEQRAKRVAEHAARQRAKRDQARHGPPAAESAD